MIARRVFVFGLVLALATSCTKVYNNDRNPLTPTPTPTPAPAPVADLIEFRVTGNVGAVPVTVKFTNSIDGLALLTAVSLPYVASIKSLEAAIFLDLEASAVPLLPLTSSLQVQIFVNGRLFREGSATGFSPLTVSVNGTWRR